MVAAVIAAAVITAGGITVVITTMGLLAFGVAASGVQVTGAAAIGPDTGAAATGVVATGPAMGVAITVRRRLHIRRLLRRNVFGSRPMRLERRHPLPQRRMQIRTRSNGGTGA